MFLGAHVLLYSNDADADRLFLTDVLGFTGVDVGGGWLILSLPPAEVAVHPADNSDLQKQAGHDQLGAALYLMCEDLSSTIAKLASKGAACTEVEEERWGIRTTIKMPSGAELGLYQPKHELAIKR